MSRLLLPGALALILAIGLVLALAGGEEDVSVEKPGSSQTQPRTAETTDTTGAGSESPPQDGNERARIVRAVTSYVEAAERGEVAAEGLPTSDELTIRRVVVDGRNGRVLLAGGARLSLRGQGAEWRVIAVSTPEIKPSPPSNG